MIRRSFKKVWRLVVSVTATYVPKVWRWVVSSTAAYIPLAVAGFVMCTFWEVWLIELTWVQSGKMRAATAGIVWVAKLMSAALLTVYADWCEQNFPWTDKSRFARWAANGFAVWSYQMPGYVIAAGVVGLSWDQVLIVQGMMLLESPLMGALYRMSLNKTRSLLA